MSPSIHDHRVHCDDLWRYEDDWEYDGPSTPEEMADPSCVECGGTGGWFAYVGGVEEMTWVMCPCTGEQAS